MFGDGTHSPSHIPFSESDLLFSDVLRCPPEKRHSMPASQIRAYDDPDPLADCASSAGDIEKGRLVPRATGLVKRRIWEIPCRTANTWVFGRSERQAWVRNHCFLNLLYGYVCFYMYIYISNVCCLCAAY